MVEPATGRLAGGDVGSGRLADPADIVAAIAEILAPAGAVATRPTAVAGELAGVTAVVTAGGTREPIDPVRYIGNRSSGKQGYAVAAELARRGAGVLISTVSQPVPAGVEIVSVETAADMETAVMARAEDADVIVMAAAVADFRPKPTAPQKLKKADGAPEILLEPTPTSWPGSGRVVVAGQVLVGFAAETAGS